MHPHYSLAKISQELGVSKTTVSLTLSGKARQVGISEEQEKRILKFCRKVDYRPNIHAQRLNSRLAKNIGILLERVEDGATAQLLGGLVDDADQAGFRTTIKVFRPDQSESIIFDWLLTHEVDGVIYYGLELPAASLERIISENWPVIGIGVSPRLGIPVVNANNFTAGHTKPKTLSVMVSGSSTSSSSTGADSPAKSANAECAQQWPRPDSNSRKIESTAPPTGEPTLRKSLRNCSTPANCDPVPHWSVSATIWRSVHRKCCCETDSAYRMILRLQASTALPRQRTSLRPLPRSNTCRPIRGGLRSGCSSNG